MNLLSHSCILLSKGKAPFKATWECQDNKDRAILGSEKCQKSLMSTFKKAQTTVW